MQSFDKKPAISEHECAPNHASESTQGGWLQCSHLLAVVLVVFICGCVYTRDINVRAVSPCQDVPAKYLVDYVEQMRYLAMRADPPERAKRLRQLEYIDRKIEEARILIEEYRKEFGFRECGSTE